MQYGSDDEERLYLNLLVNHLTEARLEPLSLRAFFFTMNIVQSFRRLWQQMKGWNNALSSQYAQYEIIKKLYAKNGLEIKMTCPACPEQYDIFKDGKMVAYYRLRHGEFRVDYPHCQGEQIYSAEPNGDGIFDDDERLNYLTKAMRKVIERINK